MFSGAPLLDARLSSIVMDASLMVPENILKSVGLKQATKSHHKCQALINLKINICPALSSS
jgi:hypothetical protein